MPQPQEKSTTQISSCRSFVSIRTEMIRLAAAPLLLAGLASGLVLGLGRPAATTAHAQQPVLRAWPPMRTAGDFLVADIRRKLDGRWAAAWRDLYPPHRLVANKLAYVTCERSTPFPAKLQSVRVLSVRRGQVVVAGLGHTVAGVAVRVRIALGWYGSRDPVVFAHTFHLVPVDGHWTWLLSKQRYRLYRADACGEQVKA
jgi:hypothetical protein